MYCLSEHSPYQHSGVSGQMSTPDDVLPLTFAVEIRLATPSHLTTLGAAERWCWAAVCSRSSTSPGREP